ncbi:MAG: IS30 family transposase, partial [bacterium]
NEDWSPEQISGALKLRGICVSHETIYRRIYAEIRAGRLEQKHLRWNRKKRRCRLAKRVPRDLTKISIESRPNISSRAEFGHWEGDTVELVRGQSYLVTMVERKTRFLAMAHVSNKKSDTTRNAILSMFRHFPQAVKSITLDNGTEFSDHKTIAKRLNAPVYFAHPHSPWERGTNENTNRLLRQYFPKKTKATYSLAYLADCRQKINTRPRKCLNFASPAQHFSRCLKLLQGVAIES